MLKKGFTLAEVLVTLGIIGIISALTLPGLQRRAAVAHLGPQLANAISTLENGMGVLLYEANVKDLTQINDDDADFKDAKTSNGLLGKLESGKYVKLTAGQTFTGKLPDSCKQTATRTLPDKSVIVVCDPANTVVTVSDTGSAEWIIVSAQSRNYKTLVEGLDYFKIKVSADGMIYIPAGSGACSRSAGGSSCASKIANNGWRADNNVYTQE